VEDVDRRRFYASIRRRPDHADLPLAAAEVASETERSVVRQRLDHLPADTTRMRVPSVLLGRRCAQEPDPPRT
jgi:hypothetical protein